MPVQRLPRHFVGRGLSLADKNEGVRGPIRLQLMDQERFSCRCRSSWCGGGRYRRDRDDAGADYRHAGCHVGPQCKSQLGLLFSTGAPAKGLSRTGRK